jgi:ABC-type transport system involved in cytochrome bd biosynthesis fused ATPase/permease subunit
MNKFDENEYQGRDPKRMAADVDALVAMLRIVAPLFLAVLLISLLTEIVGWY